MALVLQDRVREISTTTGTGTVTLSGAYPGGYRTFASCVPNGSVVYYCIHNTTNNYTDEWEVGYGTYSSNTLTRTTIYSSSNAGAAVNFSAGDKEVFITQPAEQAVFQETDGSLKIINGVIEVSIDGTEGTTLNNATFQAFSTTNGYIQNNIQNLSNGADASSDFVATNDQGSDTQFYADFGINSSGFNSGSLPIYPPNSGYIYSIGDGGANASPFYVGSGDGAVIVHAGGFDTNNTVATFGTDLSTTLEGALDVGSTLNVTGVTTLSALAYTSGNIAAAANNTVLVTKEYVDNATSNGFHVHNPVLVATTGNLTASYNNGTSGVGATLTNSGAQAALSIDGVSMNVADRVLVWQQTTGTQNGVYVVTTVGSGSTNWVLTRSSDTDTSSEGDPNSLGGGDYFFVQSGSTLGYHSFVCTNTGAITFGTTAITFSEFSSVPAYTGGTNINVNGQTISLTGTVGPTNGGTGVNTVTTGDVLYGSASNTWSKLAAGSQYKVLTMGASTPEWNSLSLSASGAVSGVLPEAYGGTNNSSYVTGDTLYASGTNTLGKLGPNTTTTKKFLSQTGTGSAGQAPAWAQPAASDITGLAASATTDTTDASNISSGTLANARTTASSSNGASTIVARDASGNFSANTITANVTGSISGSAATLTTPRNFQISGGATAANVAFDGSAAVNLNVTAMNASVINTGTIGNAYTTASSSNGASTIVARDASGNFTANNVSATNLLGSVTGSGAGLTSLNATAISSGTIGNAYTTAASANGASTIVARDASGNFSANTITATLNGNASTATSATTAGTVTTASQPNITTAANLVSVGTITSGTWSGSFGAVSGANLTTLNASNLSSGTVATARLASGTANSTTYLRGDQTWAALSAPNNGTLTMATSGTGLSGSATFTADSSSNVTFTVTSNASSSNGASTIVARDASGNFSANTITATSISASGSSLTSLNASAINSGTIGNAYTTAASANGASTIVARDASGNFSAATITATTFSGAHSGDGSALTNLNATALSSGTVASARVSGSYTGITGVGTLTAGTWNATAISDTYLSTISTAGKVSNSATTASSSNGASTIVARDASGNFSANTITANLTGTASNATYATTAGNGGVTSLTGTSNQVTVSASTGAITLSTPQSIGTASNVQFGSFGVGTAASGTTGEIRATNNVTAYYSDERLKTKVGDIENALDKVKQIQTMYYHANDVAAALGYDPSILEVGVTAQSVQKVMPQTVAPAPIDDKYLTVRYERLVPLLIEAIKELEAQVAELKAK